MSFAAATDHAVLLGLLSTLHAMRRTMHAAAGVAASDFGLPAPPLPPLAAFPCADDCDDAAAADGVGCPPPTQSLYSQPLSTGVAQSTIPDADHVAATALSAVAFLTAALGDLTHGLGGLDGAAAVQPPPRARAVFRTLTASSYTIFTQNVSASTGGKRRGRAGNSKHGAVGLTHAVRVDPFTFAGIRVREPGAGPAAALLGVLASAAPLDALLLQVLPTIGEHLYSVAFSRPEAPGGGCSASSKSGAAASVQIELLSQGNAPITFEALCAVTRVALTRLTRAIYDASTTSTSITEHSEYGRNALAAAVAFDGSLLRPPRRGPLTSAAGGAPALLMSNSGTPTCGPHLITTAACTAAATQTTTDSACATGHGIGGGVRPNPSMVGSAAAAVITQILAPHRRSIMRMHVAASQIAEDTFDARAASGFAIGRFGAAAPAVAQAITPVVALTHGLLEWLVA